MGKVYAVTYAGSVEYNESDAEVPIDEFIAALEQAKEEGATHILGLSGNYRGAQYVRLSLPEAEFDED